MAWIHLKSKHKVWFHDDKFDSVEQVFSEYVSSGEDSVIKTIEGSLRASEVSRIERGEGGGKNSHIPKEGDFADFEKEIKTYLKDGHFSQHASFRFLIDKMCAIARHPKTNAKIAVITDTMIYNKDFVLNVVLENAKFFTFYNTMFELLSTKYGNVTKGRGLVSQLFKNEILRNNGGGEERGGEPQRVNSSDEAASRVNSRN